MRAELDVRDAAREPYLAPDRPPLRISRFVTRGATQGPEVAEHLAACGLAGSPELVYGVYRVPDRIRPSAGATSASASSSGTSCTPRPRRCRRRSRPPTSTSTRGRRWVARRDRRAAPARRGPRARLPRRRGHRPRADARHRARTRTIDPYDSGDIAALPDARRCTASMCSSPDVPPPPTAPLEVGPPAGVRVELLNWDAIAAVVHPVRQHRPHLPSRFPYLPLTPQELLRAYLGIVGSRAAGQLRRAGHLRPAARPDGPLEHQLARAQDDRRRRAAVRRRQAARAHARRRARRRSPTATARPTPRAAGAGPPTRTTVLQADLSRGTEPRRPVPAGRTGSRPQRTVNRVADAVVGLRSRRAHRPGPPPPRYCWPPAGA